MVPGVCLRYTQRCTGYVSNSRKTLRQQSGWLCSELLSERLSAEERSAAASAATRDWRSAAATSSEAAAAEIVAFFDANPLPRNERKISQTVEAIKSSAKYVETILQSDAQAWLDAKLKAR